MGFFNTLEWNATLPPGSDVRFQIATNSDNQTWNFIGPDGTPNTFYENSGTAIYSGHNGDRYIRYKAILSRPVVDPAYDPALEDVTLHYEVIPSLQSLTSSPYDTTDDTNAVNRWKWSENIPDGTDIVLQLRTSPDGGAWGAWYGPDATTFSSPRGVAQITVADTANFKVGPLP